MHAYVEHNGKQYRVTFGLYCGTKITHTYDVSTQGFNARASYTQRTSWVDASGRLGQAILRKAAGQILDTGSFPSYEQICKQAADVVINNAKRA